MGNDSMSQSTSHASHSLRADLRGLRRHERQRLPSTSHDDPAFTRKDAYQVRKAEKKARKLSARNCSRPRGTPANTMRLEEIHPAYVYDAQFLVYGYDDGVEHEVYTPAPRKL